VNKEVAVEIIRISETFLYVIIQKFISMLALSVLCRDNYRKGILSNS